MRIAIPVPAASSDPLRSGRHLFYRRVNARWLVREAGTNRICSCFSNYPFGVLGLSARWWQWRCGGG